MKAPKHASALAFTAIATAAALLCIPSSNTFARPLQINGNELYRPITRPAPLFMPHNRTARAARRGRMLARLRPPEKPTTPANTASTAPQPTQRSANIVIAGMRFRPALVRIKSGDQVTWKNHEAVPHIISSPSYGLLASDRLLYGFVFKHTFKEPGVYNYYCTLNPAMMGIVIVD